MWTRNDREQRNVSAVASVDARLRQSVVETLEGRTLFAGGPLDLDTASFSTAYLTKARKMKVEASVVASLNGGFTSFNVSDASYDSTKRTAFERGAVRVNFDGSFKKNSKVTVEALQNGSVVRTVGSYVAKNFSGALVTLGGFNSWSPGEYTFRAVGRGTLNLEVTATSQPLTILPVTTQSGTFGGETLNYAGAAGSGTVVIGQGGTDTLNFGAITQAQVKNLDNVWGTGLNNFDFATEFDPGRSITRATAPGIFDDVRSASDQLLASDVIFQLDPLFGSDDEQAIYRGTSFDHLTLHDGREIYFQGIESLQFADGTLDLVSEPNDTSYANQWNHHVTDVAGAWRFTRGSSDVLLVSLDTGVLTQSGATGGIHDLSTARLVTDSTDDDGYANYGHGHSAISVMSSTANNSSMVAGINRVSSVFVADVYNGVDLQTAIGDAIDYANDRGMRVVFQGGIQGEGWLNSGGTQAELKSLISDNEDNTFFAIAAGNGGPGGNLTDANYLTSVSGVAKLESSHGNVASIGALKKTSTVAIDGKDNAGAVDLAGYSNRGSNLTLVAPTDSPAATKNNSVTTFGGTSCANPNLAAMASLVWSVNTSLSGSEVRDILTDTVMDLGTAGNDTTFGAGLVNTEAAVRKAWALGKDAALVNLPDARINLPILDYVAINPQLVIGPDPILNSFLPQLDRVSKAKTITADTSALQLNQRFEQQLQRQIADAARVDPVRVDPVIVDSAVVDSIAVEPIVVKPVDTAITDAVTKVEPKLTDGIEDQFKPITDVQVKTQVTSNFNVSRAIEMVDLKSSVLLR